MKQENNRFIRLKIRYPCLIFVNLMARSFLQKVYTFTLRWRHYVWVELYVYPVCSTLKIKTINVFCLSIPIGMVTQKEKQNYNNVFSGKISRPKIDESTKQKTRVYLLYMNMLQNH